MSEENITEAQVVADLARAAGGIRTPDPSVPHVMLVEDDEHVETIDLEKFLPVPRRAQGEYVLADVDSFIAYTKIHADQEGGTLWVDEELAVITAVLNDHSEGSPGWRDHRAVLSLQSTEAWDHWVNKNGTYLSQEAFAAHVRDGVKEIVEPAPADMLEIAETFQGKTTADWKTATRLDNGQVCFSYQEEIAASAGRTGNLEIPQEFMLAIVPYKGEAPFQIEARLRWRIDKGTLLIGYKLERPGDVVNEVLKEIADRLKKSGFTRVYMGAAPS